MKGTAGSQDADAIWHGGQRRGYDVVSKAGRYDAKSIRRDKDGYIILARRNAAPFDPKRVDRLMLLHLEASTGFRIDVTNGAAEVAARADILDAWDVPVEVLNRLMREHGPTGPAWRNVQLDAASLSECKVI